MNWTNKKPKFTTDCLLICADKIQGEWEYQMYLIKKIEFENIWYWGWCDGTGEEIGDISDLTTSRYGVLNLLKP
jgi:hypothetical protein